MVNNVIAMVTVGEGCADHFVSKCGDCCALQLRCFSQVIHAYGLKDHVIAMFAVREGKGG